MSRELTASEHQRMAEALQDPQRHPRAVDTVEVVTTHISTLLLTAEHAYKLKKPLDLGFLDFTTLESRRHACDEELRLNGRLAPEIYLQRIAITGTPDDPAIDGDGPVLDWAVEMVRFDNTLRFDRLLAADRLDAATLDALAGQVADFHARAAVAEAGSAWGTPEAVAAPARENLEALRRERPEDPRIEQLAGWTEAQLRQLHASLESRRAQGCIRECHGDLHLGNIVAIDGRPVVFDGIEFAPELRWIDTINEIAFLDMDLRSRGRTDLAARFLSAYLEATGDYTGTALLPFYRSYRALVRAKITALQRAQGSGDSAALDRDIEAYVALASATMAPATPQLILMHGLSGSGKSTVALRLVERLDGVRLRSDVERKRLLGLTPDAATESGVGAGAYNRDLSERTYARLESLAGELLGAGNTVIVDAASLRRSERERFRRFAEQCGVRFRVVACCADARTLRQRIEARQAAGTDPSEADTAVLDYQLGVVEAPGDDEAGDTLRVESPDDPALHTLQEG